jgi:hypothetical protein
MARQPLVFFLRGAVALAGLLLITLTMEPRPEVNALRAMIGVGLGIIALKVVLRRFDIEWPSRRQRLGDRRSK